MLRSLGWFVPTGSIFFCSVTFSIIYQTKSRARERNKRENIFHNVSPHSCFLHFPPLHNPCCQNHLTSKSCLLAITMCWIHNGITKPCNSKNTPTTAQFWHQYLNNSQKVLILNTGWQHMFVLARATNGSGQTQSSTWAPGCHRRSYRIQYTLEAPQNSSSWMPPLSLGVTLRQESGCLRTWPQALWSQWVSSRSSGLPIVLLGEELKRKRRQRQFQ